MVDPVQVGLFMERDWRADIQSRAAAADISASEWMRRAIGRALASTRAAES